MSEMTTIQVPKELRDRLAALRPGAKLADAIAMLFDSYEVRRNTDRLAFESRLAQARANTGARASGEAMARSLISLAEKAETQ
ncbi:hypothetical protein FEK35_27115 [Nocardia cyriacigeorgica]|uniref:Uncharacterized protein n=1 Tax=Nocardia cyriacigeorgica TaxID=135487 RepID=A0A5R8P6D9_9NOCA|nr:hypothetical protein [Nocardia cyriacigeorgica]TLF97578.1 hypothetical protein FEK35_27115 [Nocardia cyriacigeorgica]